MKRVKPEIDTSFARAAQLLLPQRDTVNLCLVGCGGTGSWLAPSIARLARVVKDSGREVNVTFVDGDTVEGKNIPRQNFCDAEIGANKAATLANRFGTAWGLEIEAAPRMFRKEIYRIAPRALSIMIGCVDNAAARKEIAACLLDRDPPDCFWLDCGNSNESGQVLLGSAPTVKALKGAFVSPRTCVALPSPALQAPDLLIARPEELADTRLSCAELMQANLQSLAVNQNVASIAADYLVRLLTGAPLKKFATTFDLPSGSMKSKALTPEEFAARCGKGAEYFKR